MDNLEVILTPKMGDHKTWLHTYKSKYNKDITDFVIEGEGFYEWINAEKPEEREMVPWKFFGQQDDVSKAYGSALTYSERYFLLKFFGFQLMKMMQMQEIQMIRKRRIRNNLINLSRQNCE
ncbi:hypothetical protein ABDI49_00030 [Bacillus cereus]